MRAWHVGLLSCSTMRGEASKIASNRIIAETGEGSLGEEFQSV